MPSSGHNDDNIDMCLISHKLIFKLLSYTCKKQFLVLNFDCIFVFFFKCWFISIPGPGCHDETVRQVPWSIFYLLRRLFGTVSFFYLWRQLLCAWTTYLRAIVKNWWQLGFLDLRGRSLSSKIIHYYQGRYCVQKGWKLHWTLKIWSRYIYHFHDIYVCREENFFVVWEFNDTSSQIYSYH